MIDRGPGPRAGANEPAPEPPPFLFSEFSADTQANLRFMLWRYTSKKITGDDRALNPRVFTRDFR